MQGAINTIMQLRCMCSKPVVVGLPKLSPQRHIIFVVVVVVFA